MTRWTLLLVGALAAWPARAEEPAGDDPELPGVGAEVPSFALPVYNAEAAGTSRAGTMLLLGEDSEDPAAKVILISFLASHCKPCRKELPVLQQLFTQYREKGLRIIGVSIDNEPEGQKAMGVLLKDAEVTFPVVKDGYNLTARRFLGTKVPLPSVFVVDREGKILFLSRGYNEEITRQITSTIQGALAGKPAPGGK